MIPWKIAGEDVYISVTLYVGKKDIDVTCYLQMPDYQHHPDFKVNALAMYQAVQTWREKDGE